MSFSSLRFFGVVLLVIFEMISSSGRGLWYGCVCILVLLLLPTGFAGVEGEVFCVFVVLAVLTEAIASVFALLAAVAGGSVVAVSVLLLVGDGVGFGLRFGGLGVVASFNVEEAFCCCWFCCCCDCCCCCCCGCCCCWAGEVFREYKKMKIRFQVKIRCFKTITVIQWSLNRIEAIDKTSLKMEKLRAQLKKEEYIICLFTLPISGKIKHH